MLQVALAFCSIYRFQLVEVNASVALRGRRTAALTQCVHVQRCRCLVKAGGGGSLLVGGGGVHSHIELALLLSLCHLLEKLVDLAVDIAGDEAGVGGNCGWNAGVERRKDVSAM